jgi:hypothetical protein
MNQLNCCTDCQVIHRALMIRYNDATPNPAKFLNTQYRPREQSAHALLYNELRALAEGGAYPTEFQILFQLVNTHLAFLWSSC